MANHGQAEPLRPTFYGYIGTTMDALTLFEACLSGHLLHVARRPHDGERQNIIKSGAVFVYEEHSSGIKRWTDGVPWSPSRILGNFLLYRELERAFKPGEKKRAIRRNKSESGVSKRSPKRKTSESLDSTARGAAIASQQDPSLAEERSLVGSLVDSYPFKPGGLVKKTISVTVGPISHHMVSYYSIEDVKANRLPTPGQDSRLAGVCPRFALYNQNNFRSPVDDSELNVADVASFTNPNMAYAAMVDARSRATSFSAGQYVQPQAAWPTTQPYAGTTTYGMQAAYPSTSAGSYRQQQPPMSPYQYDVSPFRHNQQPDYALAQNHVQNQAQGRRHSALPNLNRSSQVAYPTQMMPNGNMAVDHRLSTYTHADLYSSAVNNAAQQNIATNFNNDTAHTTPHTTPHGTNMFDQFTNSFNSFVPTSGGAMFGSTSDNTTPNNLSMAMTNAATSQEGQLWEETATSQEGENWNGTVTTREEEPWEGSSAFIPKCETDFDS
ncbi:Gti1/Pac2 family-domain-containing protein [Xylaria arbuscula]|nr:Gti1/Pac2 family-domain-containing protein [Xylaria arbuscula]